MVRLSKRMRMRDGEMIEGGMVRGRDLMLSTTFKEEFAEANLFGCMNALLMEISKHAVTVKRCPVNMAINMAERS